MTLLSLFSRHIPATCSLLKVGRIIDYGFLTTWLRSTDYYPSNGWQRYGGRIPFSKMQKALPFKRWLFLITTFGFGKTKPSSTWSSKHSFNVSISMNHYGYTVWKFHNFSISQILREINFGDSRSAKSAIWKHLEALKFDFDAFLHD